MSDKIEKCKKNDSTSNCDEKKCDNLHNLQSTTLSSDNATKYGKCKKCGKEYNCKCCKECFHETPLNLQSTSTQMACITFSTVTNATGLPEVVFEPKGRTKSPLPTTKGDKIVRDMEKATNNNIEIKSVNKVMSNLSISGKTTQGNSQNDNLPSVPQGEGPSGLKKGTIKNVNSEKSQQNVSQHSSSSNRNTSPERVGHAGINDALFIPSDVSVNQRQQPIQSNQPHDNRSNQSRGRIQIVEVVSAAPITINNYQDYVSSQRVCVCTRCGHANSIPIYQNAPFQNAQVRRYPQMERENFVTNLITDIRNDNVLHGLQEWAFPIFQYAYSYPERILSRIAFRIFDNCSLFSDFQINRKKFLNFFCSLESGYWAIPYHNRIHAADVLHACYYLTIHPIEPFNLVNGIDDSRDVKPVEGLPSYRNKSPLFNSMNSIEVMAFYAAAAMHDYDHPGRTNAFMVATNHDMATFYNDRSVLENHHAAMSWRLLCRSENFFLENMNENEFKKFRFLVMEYILATDLRHHFEHINNFTKYQVVQFDVEACRHDTLKLLMKCADICSPLKPNLLHREWTRRIVEEFYCQGDEEKRLGKQVSPFMDRLSPNIEALQHNFIRQMVTPLANALNKQNIFPCLPGLDQPELMINLKYNEQYWYNLINFNVKQFVETNDNGQDGGQESRQENDRLSHFSIGVEVPSSVVSSSTSGRLTNESSTSDYRVAVFGAGGVGKSSIVLRFIKGVFNESYVPTIEDTYRQVISCNQKNVCTLEITDTTGSHQFPAMQRLSITRGNAFILVYSITSKQSLEELGPIILMLKEVKKEKVAEVPIMLVGNKKDDQSKREVSAETGQKLADKWGCGFIETSAKENENIFELFQTLLSKEKKRQLCLNMDKESEDKNMKKGCFIM